MRLIPEDNLAYANLLKIGSSIGSGFLLKKGDRQYLVTARHVLYNQSNELHNETLELLCQSNLVSDNSTAIYHIDLNKTQILEDSISDVAVIEIAVLSRIADNRYDVVNVEGVTLMRPANSNTVCVESKATKQFNEVLVSSDVILAGYPSSIGDQESNQFDYSKPLFRKGIVAGVYKEKQTIILDCAVFWGNSGGPVLEIGQDKLGRRTYKIIGVTVQYIPVFKGEQDDSNRINWNSGYTVAASMDKVFNLINQAKNDAHVINHAQS